MYRARALSRVLGLQCLSMCAMITKDVATTWSCSVCCFSKLTLLPGVNPVIDAGKDGVANCSS